MVSTFFKVLKLMNPICFVRYQIRTKNKKKTTIKMIQMRAIIFSVKSFDWMNVCKLEKSFSLRIFIGGY